MDRPLLISTIAEHAEKFMWERIALQTLVVILLIAAAILLNV